jgi:hypothetical protein
MRSELSGRKGVTEFHCTQIQGDIGSASEGNRVEKRSRDEDTGVGIIYKENEVNER